MLQIRFDETPYKKPVRVSILCARSFLLLKDIFSDFLVLNPFSFLQLDIGWERVACGKTKDQLDLTEQARQWLYYVGNMRPRSLKLQPVDSKMTFYCWFNSYSMDDYKGCECNDLH